MIEIIVASLFLGLVSGLLAGMFGIGGGMIIVPVLVMMYSAQGFPPNLVLVMAIATSLATIIFTSIASVMTHHRLGAVIWRKVFRLTPGIVIGSAAGAVIADHIETDWLRFILIGYLVAVGIQMAIQPKPKPGRTPSSLTLDLAVAIIIGLTSALVGIGGGTMTVPYLAHYQIPMHNAVAIASACGLPIALAGTLSYAVLGSLAPQLPEWSVGYVYLPAFSGLLFSSIVTAPMGAKLANKLPAQKLKRYFSLLVFVLALKMMWH